MAHTMHGAFRWTNIDKREILEISWTQTLSAMLNTIKTDKLIELLHVPKLPIPRHIPQDELTKAWAIQTTTPLTTALPRELLNLTLSLLTDPADLICLAATCRFFLYVLGPTTVRRLLERDAAPWAGAARLVLVSESAAGVPEGLAPDLVRPAHHYDQSLLTGHDYGVGVVRMEGDDLTPGRQCPVHRWELRERLSSGVVEVFDEREEEEEGGGSSGTRFICPCVYDYTSDPLFSLHTQDWSSTAGLVMDKVAARTGLTEEDVRLLRRWVVGGEYLRSVLGRDGSSSVVGSWEKDVMEGGIWMPKMNQRRSLVWARGEEER